MKDNNIMVAVDFGSTSNRALDVAIDLAKRLSAPLDLVNVCPSVPFGASDADTPYVATARAELAELAELATAAGVTARTHVRCENVVFGLLDAIDELSPILVVLGSHGRAGVSRVLMGSISESVTRRSHVPVVIVPAPERQKIAKLVAWSCRECGHILVDGESADSCPRCEAYPAHWLSADIISGPVDTAEPSVGEGAATGVAAPETQDGPSMFVTSPAGSYDRSTPNAEIRVRRY
jgi:nucleotide-binding universal stress UspA family protein